MKQVKRRVCVIGAGPSGIAAAKNLLDEGLDIVVYDRNDQVGGNWIFSEDESHSSVFETTHIISSKTLSQYDDYPMPEDYPDYPSHAQLAAYFQGYARHFGLEPYIRFRTLVVDARMDDMKRWHVTTEHAGERQTEIFSDLVVANGHHWKPRMPQYPGEFHGDFLHSHTFKRGAPFAGKRVLVIGGGNSACDVAVETSRVSARTDISWRRGYWIVPKFMMGKPSDVAGQATISWPLWIRRTITEFLIKQTWGKNSDMGLPEPDHRFGDTHSLVNSELPYFIKHGKIGPRPDIARLDGQTVHFKDGSHADYDVIIACTGYHIAHPFFDRDFIDYSTGDVPLYLKMLHPRHDNLFFVGLFQPFGCIWPGAELQSKLIARQLVGKWQRPANVPALIEKELRNPDFRQLKTERHTITVDYYRFRKRLIKALKQSEGEIVSLEPITKARAANVSTNATASAI